MNNKYLKLRETTRTLLLIIYFILLLSLDSCTNNNKLLSDSQKLELMELLQKNGIDAEFMGDGFDPNNPRIGVFFIIQIKQFKELSETQLEDIKANVGDLYATIFPIIQKYIQERNLDYKSVKVEVGNPRSVFTDLSYFFIVLPQEKIETGTDSLSLKQHFQNDEISFDFPTGWVLWRKDIIDNLNSTYKSNGYNTTNLATTNSPDSSCVLQVGRWPFIFSFDSLYNAKKEIALQVKSHGLEVMGDRFINYDVKSIFINDNEHVLQITAEKATGEIGITNEYLLHGSVYDLIFIYHSNMAANEGEHIRTKILKSFKTFSIKSK